MLFFVDFSFSCSFNQVDGSSFTVTPPMYRIWRDGADDDDEDADDSKPVSSCNEEDTTNLLFSWNE